MVRPLTSVPALASFVRTRICERESDVSSRFLPKRFTCSSTVVTTEALPDAGRAKATAACDASWRKKGKVELSSGARTLHTRTVAVPNDPVMTGVLNVRSVWAIEDCTDMPLLGVVERTTGKVESPASSNWTRMRETSETWKMLFILTVTGLLTRFLPAEGATLSTTGGVVGTAWYLMSTGSELLPCITTLSCARPAGAPPGTVKVISMAPSPSEARSTAVKGATNSEKVSPERNSHLMSARGTPERRVTTAVTVCPPRV
mmetsp:Transcript_32419/g.82714  ORF Transcript_32419/g.82714 Transcript_32419/m.82714 type:complete len:260 (+) Transcript_32419:4038-4817(+)